MHLVQTRIRPVPETEIAIHELHVCVKHLNVTQVCVRSVVYECLPIVRCLHVGKVVESATMLVVTGLIGKLIAIAVLRQVEEDIVQRAILARAD